jgi:hypothetical protein
MNDDDTQRALQPDVLGPLYWDAIHRAASPEEVVALARIFPCCKCRGNYRLKEALMADENQPLDYDAALALWTRRTQEEGGELLRATYRLHARVNEALARDTEWPTIDAVRMRARVFPLQPRTVLDILISATAALCRSDCGYDERAIAICKQTELPLDVRCASIALVYKDRVHALKRYIQLANRRAKERATSENEREGNRLTADTIAWRHAAHILQRLEDCDRSDDDVHMQVTDYARVLLRSISRRAEQERHPLMHALAARCSPPHEESTDA